MMKSVGIFRRKDPSQPWSRLKMREATASDLTGYQSLFPDYEVKMFEYTDSYTSWSLDLKKVPTPAPKRKR